MSGFDDMPRAEFLAMARRRALEFLDAGDLGLAFASLSSDLTKHPETNMQDLQAMAAGMQCVLDRDAEALRRWIEEFQ